MQLYRFIVMWTGEEKIETFEKIDRDVIPIVNAVRN